VECRERDNIARSIIENTHTSPIRTEPINFSTRNDTEVASPRAPESLRDSSPNQIEIEQQPSPLLSNGQHTYIAPAHSDGPNAGFDLEEQGGASPEIYRDRTSTYEVLDQASIPPAYAHSMLSEDYSYSENAIQPQHFTIPQLRYLAAALRQGHPTLQGFIFQW
jgi:hypothetical protein